MRRVRALVCYIEGTLVSSVFDLTDLSHPWYLLKRQAVKATVIDVCERLAADIAPDGRTSLDEPPYAYYARTSVADVTWIVVSEGPYPAEAAHGLAERLLLVDMHETGSFADVCALLRKYQDPESAEPIIPIRADLAATKQNMDSAIAGLCERGEAIADLEVRALNLKQTAGRFTRATRENVTPPWWARALLCCVGRCAGS